MMITKPIIKNDVWIDKLYCIFFPSALKLLLRAVKLSLFLFCFSASINIQNNSKRWIEPFSAAFSEKLINKEKTAKAVWKIKGNEWSGTGFFISKNEIVTNAHAVSQAADIKEITIVQEGDPRRLKAKKIARLSIRHDLAVLEVEGVVSDFLSLPEDLSNSLKLYALGYPNDRLTEIRQTGTLKENSFFSDNSNIRGAGGGPVLNEAHELAGVLHLEFYNYIMFIDVKTLKSFINGKHFLCKGNIQECFKSSIERIEQNTQEVKSGKDSFNISMYLSRRGDLPQTKWWMEKAAEQVDFSAQDNLVGMDLSGAGEEKNIHQAKWLFKKVYALAQYSLALMEPNLLLKTQLLKKAAKQGLALAQYELALMEPNLLLKIQLLKEAAEQGYVLAQHALARIYYDDEYMHEAREWFKKAAEQGYAPAQHMLAMMYYEGKGGGQDLNLTIKWLKKAAEQGYLLSKKILDALLARNPAMGSTIKDIELFKSNDILHHNVKEIAKKAPQNDNCPNIFRN